MQYPCARLAAQGANRSSPQLICVQDLDKSSVSKISAKCLLARSRRKISRRGLLAKSLYIVDMHTDNSQDPFCVEIYRKEAGRRVRGHRFVRACAVEMHMDISQKQFCVFWCGKLQENAGVRTSRLNTGS